MKKQRLEREYEPVTREGILEPINERTRERLERAQARREELLAMAHIDERITRGLRAVK